MTQQAKINKLADRVMELQEKCECQELLVSLAAESNAELYRFIRRFNTISKVALSISSEPPAYWSTNDIEALHQAMLYIKRVSDAALKAAA